MKQGVRFLVMAVCAAAVTGCVERRYVIYTDPPGAMVLRNGQTLNATPVDDHFVYYGKYKFTIFADGYETLKRSLAARFEHDREAYTQGKTEFVVEVLRRAGHA